jgi:predicted negative regulator of RcsB-dependent stress response
LTSGIVLILNLLLAAAGFFGLKFYKNKMTEKDNELAKKLST